MNAAALFQEAIRLHDRGAVAEAAERYGQVLQADPENVEALFRLGRARCQQGRLDDGIELFRQALARDPSHARAHNLLGMTIARLGRPLEALPCFDRATASDPNFADAFANKGDALSAQGRYREAVREYDRAIALAPGDALNWTNRGVALHESGRHHQALESLDRAIEIDPALFEARANRAKVLRVLERYGEALANLDAAIALRGDVPELHSDRGIVLDKLRRFEEAVASFERALVLKPDDSEAHLNVGNALRWLKRRDEAARHYQRAIEVDPDAADAYAGMAAGKIELGRLDEANALLEKAIALAPRKPAQYYSLSTFKRFTKSDPHIAAMEEMARNIESFAIDDRIYLHFALGKAHADLEQEERSLRHLIAGNKLKRQQIDYNEAATLHSLALVPMWFTRERMRDCAGLGDPSPVPIFIVGMPRSGKTSIERLLATHPKIAAGGEREDFERAAQHFSASESRPDAGAVFSAERLRELGAAYLNGALPAAPAAARITDTLPGNFRSVGLIHLALPNARIIHARRDPFDTCLACFSTLFAEGQDWSYDLADLGRYYRAYHSIMRHWQSVLPEGVVLDVRYDEVVSNFEAQMRRIIAHCGLEWDDACLAYAGERQPIAPAGRNAASGWRSADRLEAMLNELDVE